MTAMLDLGPAVRQVAALVEGVTDDQLEARTPCARYTVRDLLGHLLGLSLAFRHAAEKAGSAVQEMAPGPGTLEDGWRSELPARLTALGAAWREPAAWVGTTRVGGVSLPGAVAGQLAVNELVIHGWDLARATGQLFEADPVSTQASFSFVAAMSEPQASASREGVFGPIVDVPPEAPLLDRALGLSGRDPAWAPA